MQVFIVGSPFETAKVLDSKRRSKQIVEAQQILNSIETLNVWSRHPCVKQYRNHTTWLTYYRKCLLHYPKSKVLSFFYSLLAQFYTPDFHSEEFLLNMKKRLYTKDPSHYHMYSALGTSNINIYYVDGTYQKYQNGKRL